MTSNQGWFESDEDYRNRVAKEADEHTIEQSSGAAASQGWFESDDSYRERIANEANELRIENSTGSKPSQGWFESDDSYSDRISREANERAIESATGSAPSQGWFESDENYDIRVRKEANEQIIKNGTGSSSKQGWFEGDHNYRSRVAHEARLLRANNGDGKRDTTASAFVTDSKSSTSTDRPGALIGVVIFIGILVSILFGLKTNNQSKITNTVTTSTPNQLGEPFYVNTKELNVRSGSGIEYSVTSKLYYGQAVVGLDTAISSNGKAWIHITTDTVNGWVNKSLLSSIAPSIQQTNPYQPLGKQIKPCVGCQIPKKFWGLWLSQNECNMYKTKTPYALESRTEIEAQHIIGYEDGCNLIKINQSNGDIFSGDFSCAGEGETWNVNRTFRLQNGMLIDGELPGLMRCN